MTNKTRLLKVNLSIDIAYQDKTSVGKVFMSADNPLSINLLTKVNGRKNVYINVTVCHIFIILIS